VKPEVERSKLRPIYCLIIGVALTVVGAIVVTEGALRYDRWRFAQTIEEQVETPTRWTMEECGLDPQLREYTQHQVEERPHVLNVDDMIWRFGHDRAMCAANDLEWWAHNNGIQYVEGWGAGHITYVKLNWGPP
jgi:hypothetical protein